MTDYIRVVIAMGAQRRVWRAIGPAASALVGVPIDRSPSRPAVPLAPPKAELRKHRKGRLGKE